MSGTYVGNFVGDSSADYSLTFKAKVKFTKKDKFVPLRLRRLNASPQFSCFDSTGAQTSSAQRGDLPLGFIAGLKVNKGGRFSGTSTTSTGLTFTVAGRLRQSGKASGSLQITQGQKGSNDYCSTGGFADPTVRWTAIFLPNVCCAQPTPVSSTDRP